MSTTAVIEQILDLARWAPSGDNTQCWRFEIVDAGHVVVHGSDTRDHCVYDLDGHPSQISIGTLLETMAIAATAHGLRADAVRRPDSDERHPLFDVRFVADPGVVASPLIDTITVRSVQRRPMSKRALTAGEKLALEQSVGPDYTVMWLEGTRLKLQAARLMYDNAKLRLTMPEAYEVHRAIIEWNARFSEDRVPDQALGVDAVTLKIMHWGMKSWSRLSKMNAVLGTWGARAQMDFLPGIACGAHFVIKGVRQPQDIDDYVAAGRAVQRFWLTLTKLDLCMQPELTPLIFSSYVKKGIRFTKLAHVQAAAAHLQGKLADLVDTGAGHPVYMGRLGAGPMPTARSVRRPLAALMTKSE
ncbi:MAG: molybdopterin biosynthesis protein MoeY [Pseudomonadota bacterium]